MPWPYVISNFNDEETFRTFYEKELPKDKSRVNVMQSKGHKHYGKWKDYDNLFSSWINQKDIV